MKLRWLFGPLLLLAPTLLPTGASATLLYAGGEDSDVICAIGGTCGVDTNSLHYRPDWAREAISVYVIGNDPPTNRFATAPFTSSSTLWVHGQYCGRRTSPCSSGTSNGAQLMRFMDTAGNPALVIRGTGTEGQLKIDSRSASGTFSTLVTCSSAVGGDVPAD